MAHQHVLAVRGDANVAQGVTAVIELYIFDLRHGSHVYNRHVRRDIIDVGTLERQEIINKQILPVRRHDRCARLAKNGHLAHTLQGRGVQLGHGVTKTIQHINITTVTIQNRRTCPRTGPDAFLHASVGKIDEHQLPVASVTGRDISLASVNGYTRKRLAQIYIGELSPILIVNIQRIVPLGRYEQLSVRNLYIRRIHGNGAFITHGSESGYISDRQHACHRPYDSHHSLYHNTTH